MLVPLAALLWGVALLLASVVPYRAKGLVMRRHYVALLWYLIALYESVYAKFSYDHLFSLFALIHSALYVLSISGSAIGSLLIIVSLALLPFDRRISLILRLVGYVLAIKGKYKVNRVLYIVGNMEQVREIDEGSPGIVGSYPGIRRYYGEISRAFSRLYNVAYEPPNGLLISLGALVYGIFRLILA